MPPFTRLIYASPRYGYAQPFDTLPYDARPLFSPISPYAEGAMLPDDAID